MDILTNVNLNKAEARNVRLQNLAVAPQNPVEGLIYYDTVDKLPKVWNSVKWVSGDSVIETIKLNGVALPIYANKTVDVEAAEIGTESTSAGKSVHLTGGSDTTYASYRVATADYGVHLSVNTGAGVLFQEEIPNKTYVDENGGKIDKIKVNGVEQTITNKEVDISVADIETIHDSNEQFNELKWIATNKEKLRIQADGLDSMWFWFERSNGAVDKSGQLTTKVYVDTNFRTEEQVQDAIDATVANYLPLAGGTMSGDVDMGGQTITGLADPANSSDAATKGYVDALTVGAFVPAGSYAFANLPAPSADTFHKMYNVTDKFTATDNFIEGEVGKKYPAGTNVAVVNVGTAEAPVYKYDALTGIVDLSGYVTKEEANGLIKTTSATMDVGSTEVEVSYEGRLINTYAALASGEQVILDVVATATSVTFKAAAEVPSAITCTVVAVGTIS